MKVTINKVAKVKATLKMVRKSQLNPFLNLHRPRRIPWQTKNKRK